MSGGVPGVDAAGPPLGATAASPVAGGALGVRDSNQIKDATVAMPSTQGNHFVVPPPASVGRAGPPVPAGAPQPGQKRLPAGIGWWHSRHAAVATRAPHSEQNAPVAGLEQAGQRVTAPLSLEEVIGEK